mmetsp:Transcript_10394/g.14675  ORF Transcript_10394/g.14675 Transcript_10394/m.14675 type:complete len:196 (-) Transcript_10394:358-945(-)
MKVTKERRGSKTMNKGAPKKPLTAYNLFFREERLNILKTASEAPRGCGTIARAIAAKWKSLDAVTRCQYEFKAQEERKVGVGNTVKKECASNPYENVVVSASIACPKMSAPAMCFGPYPVDRLPMGPEKVFSLPCPTTEQPVFGYNDMKGSMQMYDMKEPEATIDASFQKRVSLSLQESSLDKDFVDFVLSLGLV